MRITSGRYKYRNITLPEDIRPTTGRVREAIFSMVMPILSDANVLDLFAGSGALGLEALSRGAAHCWFNDSSRQHVTIIQKNVENCQAMEFATITGKDFRRCLYSLRKPMDLILLDPPYHSGHYEEAFRIIAQEKLLSPGGQIVAEHLYNIPLSEELYGFRRINNKKYGTIGVDIYTIL